MTKVVQFPTSTATRVENGADPAQRIVLRFKDYAEVIGRSRYAAVARAAPSPVSMTEAMWLESTPPTTSQDAYRPSYALNILQPRLSIALITTFAPEPYEVKKPLPISIYRSDDEYSASFFDANIHTTGDNEQEAFENIKSLLLDMFDGLVSRSAEGLGPGPRHQLQVLEDFIFKTS